METANLNGRKVLCVRVTSSMVPRLDAITFRDRALAEAKRAELTAQGTACELFKLGRTIYLATC